MIPKDELNQTTLGIVTFESNMKRSPDVKDTVCNIIRSMLYIIYLGSLHLNQPYS